jgi:hypothetical protein
MRYDMECKTCGWVGEVTCRADDRHTQTCPNEVDAELALTVKGEANGTVPSRGTCGAPLEVLIGATAITRFGFGFVPTLGRSDGTTVAGPGVRRPATVKRGR